MIICQRLCEKASHNPLIGLEGLARHPSKSAHRAPVVFDDVLLGLGGHGGALARLSYTERATLARFSHSLQGLLHRDQSNEDERRADDTFEIWFQLLKHADVRSGPVYHLLCDGMTFRDLDKRFRRRNGWARRAVSQALAFWCEAEKRSLRSEGDASFQVSRAANV